MLTCGCGGGAREEKTVSLELPSMGFPGGSAAKESICDVVDLRSIPGLGRSPRKGKGLPTTVIWPGEFHGMP